MSAEFMSIEDMTNIQRFELILRMLGHEIITIRGTKYYLTEGMADNQGNLWLTPLKTGMTQQNIARLIPELRLHSSKTSVFITVRLPGSADETVISQQSGGVLDALLTVGLRYLSLQTALDLTSVKG